MEPEAVGAHDAAVDRDEAGLIRASLRNLRAGRSLSEDTALRMMQLVLNGIVPSDELVLYLTLLAAKGANVEEIVGSVKALRAVATRVVVPFQVLDNCGTGGDRAATFNISTVAAFVVASAGQPVAKHGNRSSSGGVGSADLVEALGPPIDLEIDRLLASLERNRFAFLFAPRFRPKVAHLVEARRRVRGPTIFNLAGPLCNPALPAFQVIGTYCPSVAEALADAALRLGTRRTFVVTGPGGIDELVPGDGNIALEVAGGGVRRHVWGAMDAGVPVCPLDALRGGDAACNARLAARILSGERGAPRHAVVMNAGLALLAGGRAESLRDGCAQCGSAIDRGAAMDLLEAVRGRNDGSELSP